MWHRMPLHDRNWSSAEWKAMYTPKGLLQYAGDSVRMHNQEHSASMSQNCLQETRSTMQDKDDPEAVLQHGMWNYVATPQFDKHQWFTWPTSRRPLDNSSPTVRNDEPPVGSLRVEKHENNLDKRDPVRLPQLRSEFCRNVNNYLHRIGVVDSPN